MEMFDESRPNSKGQQSPNGEEVHQDGGPVEINGIKRQHVGLEDQKSTPSTSKEGNSTARASTKEEEAMEDRRVERCREEDAEEP